MRSKRACLHRQHEFQQKLTHLQPHKTTVVHWLHDTHREPRGNFAKWYLHAIRDREAPRLVLLFSDEAWFHLSGNVNVGLAETGVQKILLYCTKYHYMTLRLAWRSTGATKIIGHFLFSRHHKFTAKCYTYSETIFFITYTNTREPMLVFQHEKETANNSVICLEWVFSARLYIQGTMSTRRTEQYLSLTIYAYKDKHKQYTCKVIILHITRCCQLKNKYTVGLRP